MSSSKNRVIKSIFLSLVSFLVILGFALLVVSFLSFELIKPKIDALAQDGDAAPFTLSFFQHIFVVWLRFAGVISLFLGGILWKSRQRLKRYILDTLISLSSSFKELLNDFRQAMSKVDKTYLYVLSLLMLLATAIRLFFFISASELRRSSYFCILCIQAFVSRSFVLLSPKQSPVSYTFSPHCIFVPGKSPMGNTPARIICWDTFSAGILLNNSYFLQ